MQPTLDRPTDPRSPVSPLPDGKASLPYRPIPTSQRNRQSIVVRVPVSSSAATPKPLLTYRPDPGGDAAMQYFAS